MATAAGFKQQCPSCEALVPIRDPDLVGRKIDCPKCKYRFVVEDPAGAGDESPKSKKSTDKGAKKPVKAKGKRRTDEEDDDDGPSKSKSSGGSNKVLIGSLVGFAAVAALGVTAYFLFFADDGSTGSKPSNSTASTTPALSKPSVADEEDKKPKEEEKSGAVATTDMVTNLLLPDTEGVCAVKLQNFIQTPVGNAVFGAPGTFLVGGLQRNLGFTPADIDLYLQGWNFTSNWTFNVLHSNKPFDKNAIIAALKLKPADNKIQEQEYYVAEANPWLDALGRAAFSRLVQTAPTRLTGRAGKIGARFYDDQTLVLADLAPLQTFLNAKGTFEYRRPVKAEEKKEEKEAETPAPNASRGGKIMMSAGGDDGSQSQAAKPKETKPQDEVKESGLFMTVNPTLKAMLDRLDTKKPILALAIESEPAKGKVGALSADPVGFDVVIKDAQVVGAAIIWKDHLTFLVEGDYGTEDGAKRRNRELHKKAGKELADKIGQRLGTTVEFQDSADTNDPFGGESSGGSRPMPGTGGFGQGTMTPGGPPVGGGRGRMGGGKGAEDEGGGGGRGGRGGRGMPGVPGIGGPPGVPGPGGNSGFGGFGQQPTNPQPETPKEPAKATARIDVKDRTVVQMTVELLDSDVSSTLLNKLLRPTMIREKGALDMSGGRSRVHELAAASQRMVEQLQRTFPRAAMERALPGTRVGRHYNPNQRMSWMVELLPHLGHGPLYAQLNRNQSWRDADNLGAASTLIPQFLNGNSPPATWWVKVSGIPDPVAATQYVGIAGVGLDAASYSATDPAVADKIGILGYDRPTSIREITDGASNTMLMAQVPPTVSRPWLSGGGSTTVGVPEKNSIKPFVSVQGDGKKGTLVVMADGSVRFVSEKVSDEVFKALATIKGNESVILNREAPKVEAPADEVAESGPASAPATTTPPGSPATPASTAPTPPAVAPVTPPAPPPGKAGPFVPEEELQFVPEEEEQNPQGTKTYVSKEGKYKVRFPAGKVKTTNKEQDAGVAKLDIRIASVERSKDEGFVVVYLDFPAALPIGNDALLELIKTQLASQFPGTKLAGEKKLKIDGEDGIELSFESMGKTDAKVLLCFAGKRLYQVIATGPKATVEGDEANTFFESFKLVK